MAKKKTYYIPTTEIVSVHTHEMMWGLGGSPDHGQAAPKRRDPAF